MVEREKKKQKKNTAAKRKHIRTQTWTIVTDAKAVVNKVKQQNYND